ncbi:hypothetical protein CNEO2_660003 [Clostridium neonatale]|nr:hypothetical protein CNEO2_660003 [Clostridium neonatale]
MDDVTEKICLHYELHENLTIRFLWGIYMLKKLIVIIIKKYNDLFIENKIIIVLY